MSNYIDIFHKAIISQDNVDYNTLTKLSLQLGYMIDPKCSNVEVLEWLKSKKINTNSTFYKDFNIVEKSTRLDLLIDQIMHYFSDGKYIPKDENENDKFINSYPSTKSLTYITSTTLKDLIDNDMMNIIKINTALSDHTIGIFIELLKNYYDNYCNSKDPEYKNTFTSNLIDNCKNKELKIRLYDEFNIVPKDKFEILRLLFYKCTQSTLVIKTDTILFMIKMNNSNINEMFDSFTSDTLIELSKIFNRYKPIFINMKNEYTSKKINKISKLSKIYHESLNVGFWEQCLSDINKGSLYYAMNHVDEISNFKKIKIINEILYRLHNSEKVSGKVYTIRNGKIFSMPKEKPAGVKHVETKFNEKYKAINRRRFNVSSEISEIAKNYYELLQEILYKSLIKSIKSKNFNHEKIKLTKGIKTACPTSEKNFIGSYPFGSYITISDAISENKTLNIGEVIKHLKASGINDDKIKEIIKSLKNSEEIYDYIIGIYWKGEWNVNDYDLHFNSYDGKHLGWNGSYKNKSIVFSGDMIEANPEACECYKIKSTKLKNVKGIFEVDKYRGATDSKFVLYVGRVKRNTSIESLQTTMIKEDDILFKSEISFIGHNARIIANVANNKMIFMTYNISRTRLLSYRDNSDIIENITKKFEYVLMLEDVLHDAGIEVDYESGEQSANDIMKIFC